VYFLAGDGNGDLGAPVAGIDTMPSFAGGLEVADFNGDGRQDVAVLLGNSNELVVYRQE
jgi:hypothetical protein